MKTQLKLVLLIDNDPRMVDTIRPYLRNLPAHLIAVPTGQAGIDLIARQPIDLCLIDSHSATMGAVEVCRQIRQFNEATPIMILATKATEADKVAGLEAGADDYLTKPFGVAEFMARVRAMLRRCSVRHPDQPAAPDLITYQDMRIDMVARTVTIKGERVSLTRKEFDLLALLARCPGRSYERKELLKQVWQYGYDGYEHTLTAHVNRLRNKIEPDYANPTYILTSWGVGYRFAEPT